MSEQAEADVQPDEPAAPTLEEQLAQARALLAAEEQRRMQACAEEIQAVLTRYGMCLDVTQPQISLVPA